MSSGQTQASYSQWNIFIFDYQGFLGFLDFLFLFGLPILISYLFDGTIGFLVTTALYRFLSISNKVIYDYEIFIIVLDFKRTSHIYMYIYIISDHLLGPLDFEYYYFS